MSNVVTDNLLTSGESSYKLHAAGVFIAAELLVDWGWQMSAAAVRITRVRADAPGWTVTNGTRSRDVCDGRRHRQPCRAQCHARRCIAASVLPSPSRAHAPRCHHAKNNSACWVVVTAGHQSSGRQTVWATDEWATNHPGDSQSFKQNFFTVD